MKIHVHLTPDGGHTVATDPHGNQAVMYLPAEAGGTGAGIRPMHMLLMGMAGCTAVDVLLILKKKRQHVSSFRIEVEAEREPGKEPSVWKEAKLVYYISGEVEQSHAEHAVRLSLEKYCSASETLRRAGATLSWEVRLHENTEPNT